MRILYYDWDEFNGEDCRDAMRRLGHEVEAVKSYPNRYDVTEEIEKMLNEAFDKAISKGEPYDLVFSFDFFPNVSAICASRGMRYVSWVFDCPHYSIDSPYIKAETNHVFLFDKLLCESMRKKGVSTVDHMPLAVNAKRLGRLCEELDAQTDGNIVYEHEVCFLGSMYDNEYNFYDQVKYLPPELKAYVDAVIQAQERVFGIDLFTDEKVFSDKHINWLRQYISFESSGKYDIDYDKVILDILRKKVTVNERRHILTEMGKRFDTVLYTSKLNTPIEGVNNLGYASYMDKMPRVFRRSKINLNITLRSILSGVPLRVMDILGAGGFLLTTYTSEIAEYFEDGVDLAIARTPEEMIDKAEYYLTHEDQRKEIARNGQKKVFEKFAYTKLLPGVLEYN